MPWYDYQCEKCGAVFEVQHAMGEESRVKCKHCGSAQTVKIYGATGVLFKGSGFYVTDSRSHNAAATSPEPANGAATNGHSEADTTSAPVAPKNSQKAETAKKT